MRRRDRDPLGGGLVSGVAVRSVVDHYERQLARFGPTARGMDWKDESSQELRFRLLCEVCDLDGLSVHDLGAGAGHLCDYLAKQGRNVDYSGSDLSGAMVDSARQLHPDQRFFQMDLLADAGRERWDVVLCSGLFFVKLEHSDAEWDGFVRAMLRRMFERCTKALAFNLMSDHVDWRVDRLYYAGAGDMFDFCRQELSRRVVLRHDYPLHEYTVYVYRDADASE
jgi:SAM-dependent methyltransferase